MYKERTKLKDVRLHDLFPRYPATDGNRKIYLNEDLTPYRRELVEEANKRKHDGTLVSVCGPWMEKFMSRPRRRGRQSGFLL